uniref:BRCA2 OB1 domain-containing protein n=1 Tax=Aureoumbra lagunensis TaxID=44058 RepID=A0A7S3K0R1_9STRA|mmetsp:Transcript_15426/g.20431  ORF Transcript_15426/g.20431 Transcript_15426/m.20431 type:complete len:950 (-) Transcript_15426:158-3007(-)
MSIPNNVRFVPWDEEERGELVSGDVIRLRDVESSAKRQKCVNFNENTEEKTVSEEVPAIAGFTSAGSGKSIVPSDAAMKRASSLLAGVSESTQSGFMTAGSKRAVRPSEAAMKRANSLFANISDSSEERKQKTIVGFTTAGSKKAVVPSEAAMRRADTLFAAEDTVAKGFTGSKKTVIHSDATSKRMKTIFSSVNANELSKHTLHATTTNTSTNKKIQHTAQRRLSFQGARPPPSRLSTSLKENTVPVKRVQQLQAPPQKHKFTALRPLTARPRKTSTIRNNSAPARITATPQITVRPHRRSRLPLTADYHCPGAKVNAENAERLVFHIEDGHAFIMNNTCMTQQHFGYSAVLQRLCELRPGLIGNILPNQATALAWTRNHYKWEVWKAAAIERRFLNYEKGSPLQFEKIVSRMDLRIEKELVLAHKPALKAIIQHDASSRRLIILCVSRVLGFEALELTDGWYAISATLDEALAYRVRTGAITVGTKLCICSARLEGGPIDPIEALIPGSAASNESLILHLQGNGVRRARSDAKLGFQSLISMRLPLASIVARQGPVPSFEAIIARVIIPPLSANDDAEECDDDNGDNHSKGDDNKMNDKEIVKKKKMLPLVQVILLAASEGNISAENCTLAPPVSAILSVPAQRWLSEGDDGVREGDLVRVFDCEPIATRRDGRLYLRFGPRSRLCRIASPADRSLAAACWFCPRRLLGIADSFSLARTMTNQLQLDALFRCIDLIGVVLGITDDAIYLGDASPYIIKVSWRQVSDHPEINRARAIRLGEVLIFLQVELGRLCDLDLLECQLTKDSRLCATLSRLDELAIASTSNLRSNYELLRNWAKSKIGAHILTAAKDHLSQILARRLSSNFQTPGSHHHQSETSRRQNKSTTPVAAAIVNFLREPSATDGATLHDIRRALVQTAPSQTIDDAIQTLQAEYTIFLDNDHRFRIL